MYLLDSNTCIKYLNGRSDHIERRLMRAKPSSIKLCSVVKAELWYGAARSNNPASVIARLERFFAPYESIPFDDAAAGGIWPHSGASGRRRYADRSERSHDRRDWRVPPVDLDNPQHS